ESTHQRQKTTHECEPTTNSGGDDTAHERALVSGMRSYFQIARAYVRGEVRYLDSLEVGAVLGPELVALGGVDPAGAGRAADELLRRAQLPRLLRVAGREVDA